MMITKENYEVYALNYLEGTLELSLHQAMEQFLEQHPSIAAELQELDAIVLPPAPHLVFEHKASLKKKQGIVLEYWMHYLAAALILFGVVSWAIYTSMNQPTVDELAITKTPPTKKKENVVTKVIEGSLEASSTKDLTSVKEQVLVQKTAPNLIPISTSKQKETTKKSKTVDSGKNSFELQNKQQKTQPAEMIMASKEVLEKREIPKLRQPLPTTTLAKLEVKAVGNSIQQGENMLAGKIYEERIALLNVQQPKRKKYKNPFSGVKWKHIAQAIVPEYFIAHN